MRYVESFAFRYSVVMGFLMVGFLGGCSSNPPVKTQAYARLTSQRVFEYEFPVVWKAIENALRNHKVIERNPSEVDTLEMRKLTHRTLETDWIYGQSRDKYEEYQVNGSPRKKYLQTRFKYSVTADTVMGGTEVKVRSDEEIERLKSDGTSAGFESVDEADSSRLNELLDKINLSILSAAP